MDAFALAIVGEQHGAVGHASKQSILVADARTISGHSHP